MNRNTMSKLQQLYENNTKIDHESSKSAIEQTYTLLKLGDLDSAFAYTGTPPCVDTINGILVFRPNLKANVYVCVYVEYNDLYTIDYVKISRYNAEIISRTQEIFFDMLADSYEKIYDEYINKYQDGFI